MTLTIGEVFANPDHYLFAFDGDMALFREMDRASYRRSIFLDQRIDAAGPGILRVPIDMLMTHAATLSQGKAAPSWIFHIAHCGSTLLARGLDSGNSLVLREPVPLRQIAVEAAVAFAGGPPNPGWNAALGLVTALLSRRYRPEASPIVKANVPVNFILPHILTRYPDAKAILLHFNLEDYLSAILRSANHRAWVMSVSAELAPAIIAETGAIGDDDTERAAALWLAQMRIYARSLDSWPSLRSLDAEQLFIAPIESLRAAHDYFDTEIPADLESSVKALTSTYAKNPQAAFDNTARLMRREAGRRELSADLARAAAWVRNRLADAPLPKRLPHPLIGAGCKLLKL